MGKYIAKMKNGTEVIDYSITAKDLFDADQRAIKIAQAYGWSYLDLGIEAIDVKKLQWDADQEQITGQINQIQLDSLDFTDETVLNAFNIAKLTDTQVLALAHNLIIQSKTTISTLLSLGINDPEIKYYTADYQTEQANYLRLYERLSELNIKVPLQLDLINKLTQLDALTGAIQLRFQLNMPLKEASQIIKEQQSFDVAFSSPAETLNQSKSI